MDAEPPVDHATLQHAGSHLVLAHAYFSEMVNEWLGDLEDPMFARRAEVLVHALSEQLQFVVIDLKAQENAQEIFETLNARGTPLTAADLIKNYVFMRLEEEKATTESAYKEFWRFEAPFWEAEVSVGRQNVERSSLFFAQWLTAQTGDEVGPKGTFSASSDCSRQVLRRCARCSLRSQRRPRSTRNGQMRPPALTGHSHRSR